MDARLRGIVSTISNRNQKSRYRNRKRDYSNGSNSLNGLLNLFFNVSLRLLPFHYHCLSGERGQCQVKGVEWKWPAILRESSGIARAAGMKSTITPSLYHRII
jgi:hypothetical protein